MAPATRYVVGAALAIAAGAVYNLGVLVQKRAVNSAATGEGSLMARLLRDRVWLGGLALQFTVGTPMYAAAQLFIGPALIPGLMATGLVVLALGSPAVAGEKLRGRDLVAVGIVVAAVALFGASRLSVDMGSLDLFGVSLVTGFAVLTGIGLGLTGLAAAAGAVAARWRGELLALASGTAYALGNLWLGVAMTMGGRLASGGRGAALLVGGGVSLAAVIGTNVLSLVLTQRAFRHGRAATLVPLQQVPIQILPALAYFLVFRLPPAGPESIWLVVLAVALVLAGSAVLGSRTAGESGGTARSALEQSPEP